MSDKPDNFWGGFFLGAIVGGLAGALLVSKILPEGEGDATEQGNLQADEETEKLSDSMAVDLARKNLEQKIAQLNAAIDAVSQELSVSETNGAANVPNNLDLKPGA